MLYTLSIFFQGKLFRINKLSLQGTSPTMQEPPAHISEHASLGYAILQLLKETSHKNMLIFKII